MAVYDDSENSRRHGKDSRTNTNKTVPVVKRGNRLGTSARGRNSFYPRARPQTPSDKLAHDNDPGDFIPGGFIPPLCSYRPDDDPDFDVYEVPSDTEEEELEYIINEIRMEEAGIPNFEDLADDLKAFESGSDEDVFDDQSQELEWQRRQKRKYNNAFGTNSNPSN